MTPRPNMIDTQSSEWQVDPAFKPDKESTWKFPAEKDSWVLAHDSIRGEIALFLETWEMVQKRNGNNNLQAWEVPLVRKVVDGHLEHVHGHHSNEDDIMVPEVRKRFHYPKKLVIDHEGLLEKLSNIEKLSHALQAGSSLDELIAAWKEYQALMLPHLQEEEDKALPLFRAYYSPPEAGLIIKKIIAKASKLEIGSFVYFTGVDKIRHEFMPQEGIPGFVWFVDFRGKYKLYVREIIGAVQVLKAGQAPAKSGEGCVLL